MLTRLPNRSFEVLAYIDISNLIWQVVKPSNTSTYRFARIFGRLVKYLMIVGLLVLTLFFVWSTCSEYSKGETNTAMSSVPISTADNPTVTVCFSLFQDKEVEFNVDFTANYRYILTIVF